MFTLEELEKDATLLLDLKEDVREECNTLGDVTNVVLYDASACACRLARSFINSMYRKNQKVS